MTYTLGSITLATVVGPHAFTITLPSGRKITSFSATLGIRRNPGPALEAHMLFPLDAEALAELQNVRTGDGNLTIEAKLESVLAPPERGRLIRGNPGDNDE
jgi:hypothetical protein